MPEPAATHGPTRAESQYIEDKVAETHGYYEQIVKIMAEGRTITGHVLLASGGNDSTTLAHVMRPFATHMAHANTGIGIEATRQFVRELAREWDLPLIEKHPPPGSTYRELVLDQGFPGPGHHWKMYQRLKERCLRQVRAELVSNGRTERVVFIAGRRRDESQRRANIPEVEREGSVIWVSPLATWTNADMALYRKVHEVPRNPVADMLHMSGECGCGAFAGKGELEEWSFFFPEFGEQVRALEAEVAATDVPPERCRWGWGAYKELSTEEREELMSNRHERLCSSCELRTQDG